MPPRKLTGTAAASPSGNSVAKVAAAKAPDLTAIRARIDEIDTALHRLVMDRADLISEIAKVKKAAGERTTGFRPAREAMMIRRLLERHEGAFPVPTLFRVWRELLAGTNAMQGGFGVAVFGSKGETRYLNMARDQFGIHTPIQVTESEARVVASVNSGEASVGVLPVPADDDPRPWWRTVLGIERPAPRIVLRLPFLQTQAWRETGALPAIAIARIEPEATGEDRSYVAFEAKAAVSRARLFDILKRAELEPLSFASTDGQEGADATLNLMEVDGFVAPDDERLAALTGDRSGAVSRALPIGAYALPIDLAQQQS